MASTVLLLGQCLQTVCTRASLDTEGEAVMPHRYKPRIALSSPVQQLLPDQKQEVERQHCCDCQA